MEYRISAKMKDMKPSAIREIFKSLSDPNMIAFAAGNPSPESFPVDAIRRFSADILQNQPITALQYSITEGYPPLREAVAARQKKRFNVGREGDLTIITSGGQQALELACKVMCDEGDVVICENPSFIGALNAFRSLGTKLVGVGLEDDGINIQALEEALDANPRAKLIYLIPTFHNPAGITMSLEKRRAVYELAYKYGVLILEDNPYGELRFAGEELPTIKSMDERGIVIYCGSFSKILSAGMRVGFMCAPEAVIQKAVVAKQVEDVHTGILLQMICERFLTDFDTDGHVEKIRDMYRRKCSLMLSEMDKHFPPGVTYTRPEGGLFLWCTLPAGSDMPAFVAQALKKGVAVVPGTAFNCDESAPSDSFRLNYSTPSDEQIVRGIGILSGVLRDVNG
ncbi:MAG: PLP-dependent aminotransferase family protein [Eubacteriales bacterium]|nr:PLP-dependent aminotransferase family protein [Eubacteriales bacterium]